MEPSRQRTIARSRQFATMKFLPLRIFALTVVSALTAAISLKPLPSSAAPAVLDASDPGSRINIRSDPSSSSTALHYGLPGDQVDILRNQTGDDGYLWHFVRFDVSGAEGWVRGDLLRLVASDNLGQTFTSERFNFRLRYPSSYIVDTTYENRYPDEGHINLYSDLAYQAIRSGVVGDGEDFISVSIFQNPSYLDPIEWSRQNVAQSNFDDKYRDVDLAGRAAIAYTWCGLICGDNIVLANRDGDLVYVLSVGYGVPDAPIREDFEEIANSFQLLD